MLRAAVLLCMAWPSSATAQGVRGTVTSNSRPVPDAIVAIWNQKQELGRATTDARGQFAIPIDLPSGYLLLTARAIGYSPQRIPIASTDTGAITIDLVPYTTALPDLVAVASTRKCSVKDEASAHALWAATTSRYRRIPIEKALGARGRMWTGTVPKTQVGEVDERGLMIGQAGTAGGLRQAVARSIEQYGYARRIQEPYDLILSVASGRDLYFAWWYPDLSGWAAQHWLDSTFAERHAMAQTTMPDGSIDLTFCPRQNKQPSISGHIRITADSAIQSIEYAFKTPSPDERAGGRVDFLPWTGENGGVLQPLVGSFWRLVGGRKDVYVQQVMSYASLVSGDSLGGLLKTR